MPLVTLQNVSRSYGSVRALRDVSLSLEPGTIGLVGNNGAGKSTLLKIMLGLLAPDSGGGEILGHDVRLASRELRGRIGYMPEAAAMVPLLKGVEFVTLAGDLYGMSHGQAKRRAHEVLNYVGLGELRYRRLEEYSAGNQQRLKLAAALVHDPQLLLLDEPTNGLDPLGRVAMLRLIEDLIAETGKSVILCTHLLGDVERLCRQVVVLHQGTVIRAGAFETLKSSIHGRYEVAWQGLGEGFMNRLRELGGQLEQPTHAPRSDAGQCLVSTPPGWTARRFFELARDCGVVLTHLKPEEENLERLFFRVTTHGAADGEAAAPRATGGEPPQIVATTEAGGAGHGN